MQTVKRGVEFTGFVIGKCREKHVTRFEVGADFFSRKGGGETLEIIDGKKTFVLDIRSCGTEGCDRKLQMRFCKPIYGRFVTEKLCDGRCMGATGNSCDCSCGGMNHGGKHSAK